MGRRHRQQLQADDRSDKISFFFSNREYGDHGDEGISGTGYNKALPSCAKMDTKILTKRPATHAARGMMRTTSLQTEPMSTGPDMILVLTSRVQSPDYKFRVGFKIFSTTRPTFFKAARPIRAITAAIRA